MVYRITVLVLLSLSTLFPLHQAGADSPVPSPTLTGMVGLNTVPSARMNKSGTVSTGLSTLDPYAHAFFGLQIAEPLYIGMRQTAEISNIKKDPDRLYPGLDFKLRLLKERAYVPELAVGAQSALGHRRSAGEYIAFSKRYNAFDFTAGLGWGRFGSAGHWRNPLKAVHKHFGKHRSLDGEMPNEPSDWFTGETVGLFAGVEYDTPLKAVSLKFDIGADRYSTERSAFDYQAPAPWSVGVSYQPFDWANAAIAFQGTDKIMARLSLSASPKNWPLSTATHTKSEPLRPYRIDQFQGEEIALSAEKQGIILEDIRAKDHIAIARLELSPYKSTPFQIGQAVPHMANHAGPDIEKFILEPRLYGLRGPKIALMRKDFEKALSLKQGSAEEIWKNAEFLDADNGDNKDAEAVNVPALKDRRILHSYLEPKSLRLVWENQMSLAEEDSGSLYRSSLIAEIQGPTLFRSVHTGTSWRFNLKDNLDKISEIRLPALLPVRGNVDEFADNGVALDRLYSAFTTSITPELHVLAAAGYLEEMYGGAGGELLYRPQGKRFGIGLETWLAFKRDPFAPLAAGFNGDRLLTGHVQGWYEFPNSGLTMHAKAGRYLAEDMGATLGLSKTFKNQAKLEGFVTLSDTADADLFGGATHSYHGIRLTLPFGGLKHVPDGSEFRLKAAPLGRDIGQSLDAPLILYDLTENLSSRHMIEHWGEITD